MGVRRHWKTTLTCLGGTMLLLGMLLVLAYKKGYPILKREAESDPFRVMLSREVSKSIKVDGEFGRITLDGWTANTESYQSTGWPGEAIGSLDAKGISGTFDPWAILWRVWEVKTIWIDEGSFALRMPDDALKRHPIKGKRPWYAWLMPQRFHCGWIETPKAEVVFPFQGTTGRLKDVHLGAVMIKQDFKYFVHDGTLEFALLPNLGIDNLVIYVTREMADIETASLRGIDGDPARAEITARIGMQQDKSIKAKIKVTAMPFDQALPEVLRDSLTGRADGELTWDTDPTGKNTTSAGRLRLIKTKLSHWTWLEELARLHNNPDLDSFIFDNVSCDFSLANKVFKVDGLDVQIREKIRFNGSATFNGGDRTAGVDIVFYDIPLSNWLPKQLKSNVDAYINGTLKWHGPVKDAVNSSASGTIQFDNTQLHNPLEKVDVLEPYTVHLPSDLHIKKGLLDYRYENRTFFADNLIIEAPGEVTIKGSGSWSLDNSFTINSEFRFDKLQTWLPKKLEQKLSGDLSGRVEWTCQAWKLDDGVGRGTLHLENGRLKNFKFQQFLVRFLKQNTFLDLPLNTLDIQWEQNGRQLTARGINILSPGKCGLKGDIFIAENGTLSGTLLAGTTKDALGWLPDATGTVFKKKSEGLYWATIKLSGTAKDPKNDFTSQVMSVLWKHPLAMAGLAMRGLSWWLGDTLGTYEAPTAP